MLKKFFGQAIIVGVSTLMTADNTVSGIQVDKLDGYNILETGKEPLNHSQVGAYLMGELEKAKAPAKKAGTTKAAAPKKSKIPANVKKTIGKLKKKIE